MPPEDIFEAAFAQLREAFTAKTKRQFLEDIRGQIEDDERFQEILRKPRTRSRYVAVTFDRRRNDTDFSYTYFDLILVVVDALSGGQGIYKPSNQMRALQWNGTARELLNLLRYFARNNEQVRFRRALILPFPLPVTGHKIDTSIYMR